MLRQILSGGAFAVAAVFCTFHTADEKSRTRFELKIPLGLDPQLQYIPENNPLTAEKIALGKMLYFDKRLSADNSVACVSCHDPKYGFTDGRPVSTGIKGQQGGRSAPTVINRLFSDAQFWDGRAADLSG